MTWITLPTIFGTSPWFIADLNADFAAIVNALNAFNPSGAPGGPSSVYAVTNLNGRNNAGTPNTKYDVTADFAVVRNPTTGATSTFGATAVRTNDVTVAGPAVNGRDQVAVFPPSSWLHLYYIGDITTPTLSTISSLTAPLGGGPALPVGYTAWAYCGAIRFDGGSVIVNTIMRGALMSYVFQNQVVSTAATAIATQTPVNVSAAVPPNALSFDLTETISLTNGAGGGFELDTRVITGISMTILRGAITIAVVASGQMQITLPNVGQNYFYLWDVDTDVGAALQETQHWVAGYRVANGDA